MKFSIMVKQLVPDRELDYDDLQENPSGEYIVEGEDEEDALDEFHHTVPIACLDHFDIEVRKV